MKKILSIIITLSITVSNTISLPAFAQTPSAANPMQESASSSAVPEVLENLDTSTAAKSDDSLKLDPSNVFGPSAELRPPTIIKRLLKKTFRANERVSVTVQNADILEIDSKLLYSDGTTVDVQTQEIKHGGDTEIEIIPPRSFKPGKYTLEVNANGQKLEQEFNWGVLAINTNKSIYLPDETANIAMAVLDERGEMVCDAKVVLNITDPAGETSELSTDNGQIKVEKACRQKAFTLTPDYSTNYKVAAAGDYTMNLSADTQNGNYSITDAFEVRDSVDFDIERITATRLYPPEMYPVTFKMKANRDFIGTVSEFVPDSFGIYQQEGVLQYRETKASDDEILQKEEVLGAKTIAYPFKGEEPITQGFGEPERDPLLKKLYYDFGVAGHDGLDFGLPEGTPVAAVDDGKVVVADAGGTYGSTIVIEHTWGKSYYGHLSKFLVEKEQEVVRGDTIALSGSTGLSTGPHLHFGIKLNNNNYENGFYGKVNPAPFLGIKQDSQVLGTSTINQTFQKITWDISVKKGEDITFGYKFKAPNISPQLYRLGPLQLHEQGNNQAVFQEARQWKLAVDAPNNQFVKTGTITKPNGTNSALAYTGVGFKPKAVIFYWTNQTANGTTSEGSNVGGNIGIGFATDSTHRAALSGWDEGQTGATTLDNGRDTYNNKVIVILTTATGAVTNAGLADLVSFDPDGFTLNWSTSNASQYLIRYMAFSENIISNATVNSFSIPTSGATVNVTNAGFQPDFVMFFTGGTTTHNADTNPGFVFTVGAASSSTSEWTSADYSTEAVSAQDLSDDCMWQRTDASIALIGKTVACGTTTEDALADFTQFTSNGFDINVSNFPSTAFDVFYLALKGNGTSFAAGSFSKPITTGNSSVTGTGFLPAGAFFVSKSAVANTNPDTTSAQTVGILSIGSTSGVGQEGAVSRAGADNVDASTPDFRTSGTKAISAVQTDSGTLTGEANLTSFNTNGFTLNWTTANATADEYLYWAIGEILDNPDLMRHGKWFHNGVRQPFAF